MCGRRLIKGLDWTIDATFSESGKGGQKLEDCVKWCHMLTIMLYVSVSSTVDFTSLRTCVSVMRVRKRREACSESCGNNLITRAS